MKRKYSHLFLALIACLGCGLVFAGVSFTATANQNISSIIYNDYNISNRQLLIGCGFSLIGGTTEDTEATNLVSCGGATSTYRAYPGNVSVNGSTSGYYMSPTGSTTPWLPHQFSFTLDSSNLTRMFFSAQLGPAPQDIDTVSLPLAPQKSLFTHFRYSGSSLLSYATAPSFAYFQNGDPNLPISIFDSGTSSWWGEAIGLDHTIRYTLTSANRTMRLFFVNHPDTNDVEFSIDPTIPNDPHIKTGDLITVAGKIEVFDTDPALFGSPYLTFETENSINHQIGRVDYEGDGWSVNVVDDQPGYFMNYGPYTQYVTPEAHTAVFRFLVDNVSADNNNILYIDVYDSTANTILASRELYRSEFITPFKYKNFKLDFTPAGPYHVLEFRTYWRGGSYVKQDKVVVR